MCAWGGRTQQLTATHRIAYSGEEQDRLSCIDQLPPLLHRCSSLPHISNHAGLCHISVNPLVRSTSHQHDGISDGRILQNPSESFRILQNPSESPGRVLYTTAQRTPSTGRPVGLPANLPVALCGISATNTTSSGTAYEATLP